MPLLPSRPDSAKDTYRFIPAMVAVQPSSGTVSILTLHGDFAVMPNRVSRDGTIEEKFRRLADEWISETAMFSDPVRIFLHRAHFKIIGMGEKALPLILREVEKNSAQWFVALEAISPINPVKREDEKSFERTAQAWIRWGKSEGLI